MLADSSANAIELSALREHEVKNLVDSIKGLNLTGFKYVSFHAPSKLLFLREDELINILAPIFENSWPVVIHPDIITNYNNWKKFGSLICIENMDKRKKEGRTTVDLQEIFLKLPDASFCFDIAHAKQVDPTMTEAYFMITKFKNRLREIHISSVNTQSKHEPLNFESLIAFKTMAEFIPEDIPIILESPVSHDSIEIEMNVAEYILSNKTGKSSYERSDSAVNIQSIYIASYSIRNYASL